MSQAITIAILANGRQARQEIEQTATATQKIGNGFKKAAIPAALVAGGLIKIGAGALKAVANVERINAQTTAVVKSTGGAAKVTAGEVEALANKLEKVTTTEAEATQEGANLLLTFTNIKNEAGKGNDVFNQTTTAMVDLARAMGTEPKAAAIQLGKALNDPIKGVGALSRVGVSFTEQQKKTIKSLVESGDTMGAQKIILSELEKQFGGSGEAYAKTAEGMRDRAANAWGNMTESLVVGLMPAITELITVGTAAMEWASENEGIVKALVITIAALAAGVLIVNGVMAVSGAVMATYRGIVTGISVVTRVWAGVQWLLNAAMLANPIGLVVLAIVALVAIFVIAYKKSETFRNIINGSWILIKAVVSAAVRFVVNIVRTQFQILSSIVRGAMALVKAIFTGDWGKVKEIVRAAINKVMEFVRGIERRVRGALTGAGSWLLNAGKRIVQGLIDGIVSMIGRVRDKLGELTNLIPDWKGPADRDARLLRPAGRLIIGGLVDGLADEQSKVQRFLGALSQDISTFSATPRIAVDLSASDALNATVKARSERVLELHITSDEIDQVQRGKKLKADITAAEKVGARTRG